MQKLMYFPICINKDIQVFSHIFIGYLIASTGKRLLTSCNHFSIVNICVYWKQPLDYIYIPNNFSPLVTYFIVLLDIQKYITIEIPVNLLL